VTELAIFARKKSGLFRELLTLIAIYVVTGCVNTLVRCHLIIGITRACRARPSDEVIIDDVVRKVSCRIPGSVGSLVVVDHIVYCGVVGISIIYQLSCFQEL
jgi:hypothetical protein